MKKYILFSTLITLLVLVLVNCKKIPEIEEVSNKKELAELTTVEISNITINSAQSGGKVTNDGNLPITAKGVCWDTSENPTLDNHLGFTDEGSGTAEFISQLTELSENTTFYIRAYAVNERGTSYGVEKQFKTLKRTIPLVTTKEIGGITTNSAISGGEVVNDGYADVTIKGICWSKNENPTIDNCDGFTTDGDGLGAFISNITNLEDSVRYYVVAYATNEIGTTYGNIKSFTTMEITIPTITTTAPTNITINSALSGGKVINNGYSEVISRGICWNTTGNPSLDDNLGYTSDGSGIGSFTSSLTDLDNNTSYHVVAYATNSEGTAYGNEFSLTTLPPPWECGDMLNYEGQDYSTVIIGTQCWMTENLNVGIRINGDQEMQNNSTIEKYCHSNNEDNCDIYGGLYPWDEMMQYSTEDGVQGICPNDWHIPTNNEWTILTDFLGGENIAGGKMKEEGYEHWNSPNTGATNSSEFTALPAGNRYSTGAFGSLGGYGVWWSSTEYSGTLSWSRILYYDNDQMRCYYNFYKTRGISVRCIKN